METYGSPFTVGLNPTQHQIKLFKPKKEEYDEDEVSPLHVSAYFNKPEFIRTLISDCDQDLNIQDSNGTTPLMIAAKKGNIEAVEELLKYNKNAILQHLSDFDFQNAFYNILNEKKNRNSNEEKPESFIEKERGNFLFTLENNE